MPPRRAPRGRAAILALVSLVAACATSTRPPPATSPSGLEETTDTAADEAPEEEAPEQDDDDTDNAADPSAPAAASAAPCPTNMVLVEDGEARFCVDRYEASLVEVDPDGTEKPFPHWLPVDGRIVRAVSAPDVFPQGYISEVQAEDACAASGKRLCAPSEWKTACMGPSHTTFPYGNERRPGACHDKGKSAVFAVFGARAFTDPVATAAPRSKPTRNTTRPAAQQRAAQQRGKGSRTKPRRQAIASVKGRAAETVRTRPARTGSVAAAAKAEKSTPLAKRRKASKASKASKTSKTSSAASKPSAKAGARIVKRGAAKTTTRPVSVEPSVWTQLNDPRLGQIEGALSPTGSHEECVSGYGVFDMVGNIHEWVKTDTTTPHGTFAGGYYLDTTINGDGCHYRTRAHAHDYHDYSTGFRCCVDPAAPAEP